MSLRHDGYRLRDGTGVQTALVLDALYGKKASQQTYGVDWHGDRGTFRIWAPTAQRVALLTWPTGSVADAPVSAATRTVMRRVLPTGRASRSASPRSPPATPSTGATTLGTG